MHRNACRNKCLLLLMHEYENKMTCSATSTYKTSHMRGGGGILTHLEEYLVTMQNQSSSVSTNRSPGRPVLYIAYLFIFFIGCELCTSNSEVIGSLKLALMYGWNAWNVTCKLQYVTLYS